jgi:hypothetical protein
MLWTAIVRPDHNGDNISSEFVCAALKNQYGEGQNIF